ncbi:MAG: helix-turn-helix domain-containing protein [Actinomycetota bacterium]|nr:helix-turn-helix domain-containing protein [Actinomycetota bacterium]
MASTPSRAAELAGDVASTGVAPLDDVLGGLFWGDNVVFEVAEPPAATPFYRAVAGAADQYDQRLYVSLSGEEPIAGFDVVDAGAATSLAQPAPLLRAIIDRCRDGDRNLLVFEAMETMIARWGADVAGRFFAHCCPQLLELGAIAYWSVPAGEAYPRLRRTIEEVTQCVLAVGESRLRVAKADGRPPGVEGSVFRYRVVDGLPELTPAPIVARVGAALRAARTQRRLSQSDLARLAGVSPSAISQAERGQRGLSLETLLELTGRLGMTVDELLRGDVVAGYRLGRRHHPRTRRGEAGNQPLPLLDDPAAGLRTYVVHLPPRGSGSPHVAHKGVELVAVASGLVQVVLATGRPVLRRGEVLLVEATSIDSWRNLGPSEATLFWVLRD